MEDFLLRAAERPPEYVSDLLGRATVKNGIIQWDEDVHNQLLAKYNPEGLGDTAVVYEDPDNAFRLRVDSGHPLPGQVDVVWMLGKGSSVNDWELRMSMRSFRCYYKAEAVFWLIGHIPDWVDRELIRCIEWPDSYRSNKDANLLNKAVRMALEPDLSDKFILCSDDHLLIKESEPDDFKWWHLGEIKTASEASNPWQVRLFNTAQKLRAQKLPTFNYEGHVPYPVYKEWCREALRFDYGAGRGMTVFSTILNAARVPGEHLHTSTVRGWLGGKPNHDTLVEKCWSNRFICLNGESVHSEDCIHFFNEKFSMIAPWEKSQ